MKTLRFFSYYSIDVSLGAMISTLFFAKILHVGLSYYTTALLGLSVWIIYTFDHLEDARHIVSGEDAAQRYLLHKKYFKLLSYLLILALCIAAVLIFYIPRVTLVWGTAMICAVSIYFILLKFLNMAFSYYKEFIIAIIYSAGVFLGPVSLHHGHLYITHYILFLQFALIALTNLIVYSLYEEREDKRQRFPSLVQVIGIKKSERLLFVLVSIQALLTSWLIFQLNSIAIPALFATMGSVLFMLALFRPFFKTIRIYRLLGDAVFLFPVVVLL